MLWNATGWGAQHRVHVIQHVLMATFQMGDTQLDFPGLFGWLFMYFGYTTKLK